MKYLKFKNGDKIPMLGLGTYRAEEGEVYKAIRSAIEIGYRHFDCAYIYSNQKEIGNALKDANANNEVTREDLWITSKLWNNAHKEDEVEPALQETLDSLQLDYLDLYLIHWPIAFKTDEPAKANEFYQPGEVSLSETWSAMIRLKDKNLVKHIGVSNFNTQQINKIINETRETPEMNQVEIQPYLQQKDLKEHADSEGYFLTAYKPIGSGDYESDKMKERNISNLMNNETMVKIAQDLNCTVPQVSLAWLRQRGIIAVPKSTHADRQKENFESLKVELSQNQMDEISQLEAGFRYVDGTFFTEGPSPYSLGDIWG